MAVVDIRTIKRNYLIHFFLNGFANGFNTQNFKDFTNIVGGGTFGVDVIFRKNLKNKNISKVQKIVKKQKI